MEPGHDDGTECQKTRETIPGTLPGTKRTEEMMTEQNARIPGTKKSWWKKLVLGRVENPIQLQSSLGNMPQNPSRNQEMMMEQDARAGNKPQNPSRNQERMMEQDARRVGRQAPEP